jgi:hypothetical protein
MLKNYRYISDTKLDMLSAQIPQGLRDRIAAELSINVQVFALTLKQAPSDTNRYSKLNLVVNYIEKHEPVGTVDEPQVFFRGKLPLYWGPIGEEQQDIIYFGANLPDLTFGLVGSRHYTIGSGGTPVAISPSVYPNVLQSIDVETLPALAAAASLAERYQRFGSIMDYVNRSLEEESLPEDFEFLAIRLLRWPNASAAPVGHAEFDQQKPFLLGSPIYVAGAGG